MCELNDAKYNEGDFLEGPASKDWWHYETREDNVCVSVTYLF